MARASSMVSARHGAGHRHLAWFYAAAWPDFTPPLTPFVDDADKGAKNADIHARHNALASDKGKPPRSGAA
jgi:hypothetical protein